MELRLNARGRKESCAGIRETPAVARRVEKALGRRSGVLFREISRSSAAATAGLRHTQFYTNGTYELGDVLVAIDGEAVEDSNDLRAILAERDVGDTVTLMVIRDEGTVSIPITLQALAR